jgi:hypothetical protein
MSVVLPHHEAHTNAIFLDHSSKSEKFEKTGFFSSYQKEIF